jgi:diphthine synthase
VGDRVLPLYIVGGGISAEYLTLKALKIIMSADKVYVDTYTSIAPGLDDALIARLNPSAEVVKATRNTLEEGSNKIIEEAKEHNIVVVVPGDPHLATTHISLIVEARRKDVEAHIIPGVSGLYAVIDECGLQVYRFGKVVTLVYPEENYKPYTTIEVIHENYKRNLHTMVLLDLRLDAGKAMTIPEAVDILLEIEQELTLRENLSPILEKALLVGVARAGLPDSSCIAGRPEKLKQASYPPPPHTIIVTAPKLHPIEEEALQTLCNLA